MKTFTQRLIYHNISNSNFIHRRVRLGFEFQAQQKERFRSVIAGIHTKYESNVNLPVDYTIILIHSSIYFFNRALFHMHVAGMERADCRQ